MHDPNNVKKNEKHFEGLDNLLRWASLHWDKGFPEMFFLFKKFCSFWTRNASTSRGYMERGSDENHECSFRQQNSVEHSCDQAQGNHLLVRIQNRRATWWPWISATLGKENILLGAKSWDILDSKWTRRSTKTGGAGEWEQRVRQCVQKSTWADSTYVRCWSRLCRSYTRSWGNFLQDLNKIGFFSRNTRHLQILSKSKHSAS